MNVTEFFSDMDSDWGLGSATDRPKEEDGTSGQRRAVVPRHEGLRELEQTHSGWRQPS
jgi:hypothetical protein